MKAENTWRWIVALLLFVWLPSNVLAAETAYTLSGPYTHSNLQIFLIHGQESITNQKYITLTEAMQKKVVVVHETGDVQQLAIENTSKDVNVFIHSGDIVKGGRQDRVISFDVIIPPRSGKVPLNSFCVESGRWAKRGKENTGMFASNSAMVSSRELRIAAKHEMNQGNVWSNVAAQQKKLNHNMKIISGKNDIDVTANASSSSLQLTLENKELKQMADEYLKQLTSLIKDKDNVLGFAFLINGEINNADVYGRKDLFADLWPKLLGAAVVEAISEYQQPKETTPKEIFARRMNTVEGITAMFTEVKKAKESKREVNERTQLVAKETKKHFLFETRDQKVAGKWLHRNYIKKDPNAKKAPPPSNRVNPGGLGLQNDNSDMPQQQRIPSNQKSNNIEQRPIF
jgi:ARG/rhodanese/phosphatase superfamily protein